ncbi:hypothetical protein D1872_312400 [compost metagenome]
MLGGRFVKFEQVATKDGDRLTRTAQALQCSDLHRVASPQSAKLVIYRFRNREKRCVLEYIALFFYIKVFGIVECMRVYRSGNRFYRTLWCEFQKICRQGHRM